MTEVFSNETLEIAPYLYPATWLIGASTHAIDRFEPDVERIFQPEGAHVGGTITFNLSATRVTIPARKRGSRKLRFLNRIRPPALIDLDDKITFDIRDNEFFNWSHQVNFFLSLALAARSRLDEPITIILPSGLSSIARDLYRQFGFATVFTDGPLKARNFEWAVSHVEVVTSARPQLIAPFMDRYGHDTRVFPEFDLPKKVFLSRRGTRSLLNEEMIEDLLSVRGFRKIYSEDLNVPEQFSLLRQAEQVVAIHGAGLAPLQYRPSGRPPVRLVELAPAGIVTRWFGIMCDQVGGKYIAVRGRLKPEYIEGLYAQEPFVRYCDDKFEIESRSLEVALDMIESA